MKKTLPLLVFFVLVLGKAFSQADSTSKAVIYFKQKEAIIYLDGKKITSDQKLRSLKIGKHTIKAWAPTYDLFVDSFYTKKGMNEFYTRKLSHSENYKFYRNKKRLRKTSYLLPGMLSLVSAGTYYTINKGFDKRINTAYNDALMLQDVYNGSFAPDEFQMNAENYESKRSEYERLQKQQKNTRVQGIVISSALAATAITFFIIQKLKPKLEFKETPLLARFQPSYDPFTKQLCLTVKLH